MLIGYEELPRFAGRVAMADGCFDPLHAGHVAYFAAAAAQDLPLLVNVQSDEYIRAVKGRSNLLPEAERAALVDALSDVSYVHLCRTSTADVLRQLRPAAYVKGADWRDRLPREQVELCAELGIDVVYLDSVQGSSTEVVSRFMRGQERIAAPPVDPPFEPPVDPPYAAVVTSHTNPYLSGVAKFSSLLSARLGAPCLALAEARRLDRGPLLLSVKLSDNGPEDAELARGALADLKRAGVTFDVFLHAYTFTAEERAFAASARRVFAGNEEIAVRVAEDGMRAEALWCPELLDRTAVVSDKALQLFSFGMAHKVRLAEYEQLRDVLAEAGIDYELTVSTAFHEKANFGQIDEMAAGFRHLFGERVTLLGFLSDAALRHFLTRAHAFVAFFPSGVRANNTSVAAAMAAGRVVVTDLDAFSPRWMRHAVNVLDISRLSPEDLDPARLLSLGGRARRDVAVHAGWPALTDRLLAEARESARVAG